jgi:hypothetical protein
MRGPKLLRRLFWKILEEPPHLHNLHHFEIRTTKRVKKAYGLGKIIVLLLGVHEFIGIYNLLIVFPFTHDAGAATPLFVIINAFPIVMKNEFIGLKGIGPL